MKYYCHKSVVLLVLFFVAITPTLAIDSGQVVGRNIYGLATDYRNDPVMMEERPLIYESSRFEQVVNINDQPFLVSGFDHSIGAIYISYLDKETKIPLDTVSVNSESIGGVSSPVTAVLSEWNSVLFSEGGIIDSKQPDDFKNKYSAYYKGNTDLVNPYNYGWLSEVIILDIKGQAKVIKNYAVGRLFADSVLMMPDGKTFYTLDVNGSGNFYMFVAEQRNSLAKGTIYIVGKKDGRIVHTPLGETSALKMKFKLRKMAFNKLFKVGEVKDKQCEKPYEYIKTIYGEECLKINKKNRKYAGLFEPIRLAALKKAPPFESGLLGMRFDPDSQRIFFQKGDQSEFSVTLGQDSQFDSQYVIREMP